ncbi:MULTISPECIES: VOC family protein [Kocuria]|uniref:Glyoxalase n=1 Tax=Kocuria subflava TaxID=1736139 RepID=A0A846TXU9_9MICC|nr:MULTISPECIES: VOC family protein [Kocuria]NKE10037.1 glyoxalase [Kocuria subflava]
MHQYIFVNLPVEDVERSRKFFTQLGYTINEDFSDDKAISVVLGQNMFAMLLHKDFFASFHQNNVSLGGTATEVLVALDAGSREEVDSLVDAALEAGATAVNSIDHGTMYGRSFADMDGHIWELTWMDMEAHRSAQD